ncbi:MAG: exo-alpha-sialidase [Bacteroidales bacterium]|nr:exo-alpha-sialidase [Bacteroidales bacterium]
MRTLWTLCILGSMCLNSPGQNSGSGLPEPAVPGENAYLRSELIFRLDNRPTPECHASTLVETSSGITAAWFGGSHEKNRDVGIWISHLDGDSWSTPVEVANGVQNDTLRYPCWNPVLFQPFNGPLMLFYKVGPSPRDWWGELITSEDQGYSWSPPRKLGESVLGPLIGPVKNKPIQFENGSILCPSSTERIEQGQTYWQVHFELSRDLGKSWKVIGPINDGIEFDAIQPSILSYENGDLQILCRTMQNVISESWSSDGGYHWSPMKATQLPNPSAGTDALTLKDGRQLLVYNHSERGRNSPGRGILNVALSEDGISWTPVITLENQKGEFSYPAVIQSSDNLVHISYTYNRKSVKYVVFDPAKLELPPRNN